MLYKIQTLGIIVTASLVLLSIVLAANTDSKQDTVLTGKDVYRLNCASCHGADRTGDPSHYPTLLNIEGKLSSKEIREIIEYGKDAMPAFHHLTQQEVSAIMAFMFDEKAQSVEISTTGLGERIFKSNCSSCHRASTDDPKPTNVRMMKPAVLAGATKRFSKDEFFRIMDSGICYMPSFDHFTSSEREALYVFVKSLEGKGEPTRPTMGEMCPMMMKMRK